jgi:hypothetical protein
MPHWDAGLSGGILQSLRVLVAGGYKGFYCFEWEKKWHPEIEDPEVASPHCAKAIGQHVAKAGVKAS